jgi:hypothetical protein
MGFRRQEGIINSLFTIKITLEHQQSSQHSLSIL